MPPSYVTEFTTPPPTRADSANFSARADIMMIELVEFVPELNIVIDELNALALDAITTLLYLGAHATPPTMANDEGPLTVGMLYYRTTDPTGLYIYDGAAWRRVSLGEITEDGPEGQVAGGYYLGKILDTAVVAGVVTMSWQAATYTNYTNTESHYITWVDMPLIGSNIGQTVCLTIDNAGDYPIIMDPELGYILQKRVVDDGLPLTEGGRDEIVAQVSRSGVVSITINRDFVDVV